MKKIYAKEEDFQKEIEFKWDNHDKEYVLTKRHVSGKNSQGHSMSFSEQEIEYLKDMIREMFYGS